MLLQHPRTVPFSVCLLLLGLLPEAGRAQSPGTAPDRWKMPALLTAPPLRIESNEEPLRALLKARYNEAVSESREHYRFRKNLEEEGLDSRVDVDRFYQRWERVISSGLEVLEKPSDRVALLAQYVEVLRNIEKLEEINVAARRLPPADLHRARYERINAEIQLLRARADEAAPKGR
jgi:hypothetical protein